MDLIKVYKNSLGQEMCQSIINIFENSDQQADGQVQAGINLNIKRSTDIHSSLLKENKKWVIIENIIRKELTAKLDRYYWDINGGDVVDNINDALFLPYPHTEDAGFQIQKYNVNNGFYKFHNDFNIKDGNFRTLTYLWYLNDVEEGGETEFYNGLKIKPEAGKLLIFPALWTYSHRGLMPISNNKYILTGWIYSNY